jgi:hypothetical protein
MGDTVSGFDDGEFTKAIRPVVDNDGSDECRCIQTVRGVKASTGVVADWRRKIHDSNNGTEVGRLMVICLLLRDTVDDDKLILQKKQCNVD